MSGDDCDVCGADMARGGEVSERTETQAIVEAAKRIGYHRAQMDTGIWLLKLSNEGVPGASEILMRYMLEHPASKDRVAS